MQEMRRLNYFFEIYLIFITISAQGFMQPNFATTVLIWDRVKAPTMVGSKENFFKIQTSETAIRYFLANFLTILG